MLNLKADSIVLSPSFDRKESSLLYFGIVPKRLLVFKTIDFTVFLFLALILLSVKCQ
ncbi:hypothetical protein RYE12_15975 [Clostridioides difficile]|nr:hypothetical protein [Clostridioides difficile]MCM4125246.1 hypothetical protein [Clostridioides difficile]MDC2909416.1 hypothetical protein [Clostridioides difficile]MDS6236866.1 hypothetical protein [Clostridioides difficile]MDU8900356.1 hypothetical protein [Clostridioides difficile]